jgi:hypothetical protein
LSKPVFPEGLKEEMVEAQAEHARILVRLTENVNARPITNDEIENISQQISELKVKVLSRENYEEFFKLESNLRIAHQANESYSESDEEDHRVLLSSLEGGVKLLTAYAFLESSKKTDYSLALEEIQGLNESIKPEIKEIEELEELESDGPSMR